MMWLLRFSLLLLAFLAGSSCQGSSIKDPDHRHKFKSANNKPIAPVDHEDIEYWMNKGRQELDKAKLTYKSLRETKAKNIIVFLGDGMSIETLTASRIYKAQRKAELTNAPVNGEENLLAFERFPHAALSRTYSIDGQTPDSAATATAIFNGVKTNSWTLGFDNKIVDTDPASEAIANPLTSILTHAQNAGKDTGFITNTRVSHATPAALYAHSASRGWECLQDLQGEVDPIPEGVHDITWQLMNQDPGKNVKVIFGGGRRSFLPPEKNGRWDYEDSDWNCHGHEGRDFITEFANDTSSQNVYVETKEDMEKIDVDKTDRILGLFSWSYMHYDHERRANDSLNEPSLSEMTSKAIEMLRKNKEKGFFLMVEGGLIDHAHHGSYSNRALDETMAFDDAVEAAIKMVDLDETLVIVTADHGHSMAMSGYQTRGSDIRGVVDNDLGDDDKPYSILGYTNGGGFYKNLMVNNVTQEIERLDLSDGKSKEFKFKQNAGVGRDSETHSGGDVGIYAAGPYAHLFHGVHEQSYIFHVMAYSACLGPYENEDSSPHCTAGKSSHVEASIPLSVLVLFFHRLLRT